MTACCAICRKPLTAVQVVQGKTLCGATACVTAWRRRTEVCPRCHLPYPWGDPAGLVVGAPCFDCREKERLDKSTGRE